MTDEIGVVDLLGDGGQYALAQADAPRRLLAHLRARQQSRLTEADDGGHVLGRRAQSALLAAAVDDRRERDPGTHVERPDAFGAVQLVGRQAQQVDR